MLHIGLQRQIYCHTISTFLSHSKFGSATKVTFYAVFGYTNRANRGKDLSYFRLPTVRHKHGEHTLQLKLYYRREDSACIIIILELSLTYHRELGRSIKWKILDATETLVSDYIPTPFAKTSIWFVYHPAW
ncbi:hypothetical protein ACJMK2_042586 [Sinanodonta woodiana]|uniref:Uncharacterized protein n=1 Tax=Sinanodonta woodiana TaxID=1069815 RepID=A0ABD3W9A2_SINWO